MEDSRNSGELGSDEEDNKVSRTSLRSNQTSMCINTSDSGGEGEPPGADGESMRISTAEDEESSWNSKGGQGSTWLSIVDILT